MKYIEALYTLRWHAQNVPRESLVHSCMSDAQWNEAYYTVFGDGNSPALAWAPDSEDGTCWDLLLFGQRCMTWVCKSSDNLYTVRVTGKLFHKFQSIKEASEFVMSKVLKPSR